MAIFKVLPSVLDQLGIAPKRIANVEMQITAHNDGHYYKLHNDNGSSDALSRTISYVYYLHGFPKMFMGGELVLYDGDALDVDPETAVVIEPRSNSIIFFHSGLLHEVRPIICKSQAFRDGRFSINGWIRHSAE